MGTQYAVRSGKQVSWTGTACGGVDPAPDPYPAARKTESGQRIIAAGGNGRYFVHSSTAMADHGQL